LYNLIQSVCLRLFSKTTPVKPVPSGGPIKQAPAGARDAWPPRLHRKGAAVATTFPIIPFATALNCYISYIYRAAVSRFNVFTMKKQDMKKSAFLLFTLCFSVLINAQQSFEIMNKKPVPGSVITIEYMPRSTVLQGVKDFEATAYLLEGKLPLAKAISLKQEGGVYRGTVKTNDTTRAVFFSFGKDDKKDNNNDEGYYTPLYDKKGEEIAGSNLALANAFANYGGIWGPKTQCRKEHRLQQERVQHRCGQRKILQRVPCLFRAIRCSR
jgi:hypothetical protein